MSLLSCIGKRSKKKSGKNGPIDKRHSTNSEILKKETDDLTEISDENVPNNSNIFRGSDILQKSTLSDKKQASETEARMMEKDKKNVETDTMISEIKMYKAQINQLEVTATSYQNEIRKLEITNLDLKTRVTVAETNAAKIQLENQKLLQKIVGMEENQAMMSRAELHSMIAQLEETELKASCKPVTELSGIRTNPADLSRKNIQEDRQMSLRLSKTEERLCQSEDENMKLRADLKEMLESNTELQQIIVSDETDVYAVKKTHDVTICRDVPSITKISVSTETKNDNSDTDIDLTTLQRLKNAETEQAKLQNEYDCLAKSMKSLLVRLQKCEEENFVYEQNKENENILTRETDFIFTNLKELEKEQIDLKRSMTSLEALCEKLNDRIDVLYAENIDVKTLNDSLMRINKEYNNDKEKRMQEIESLRNEVNKSKYENQRLSDDIKSYSKQLQKRKDTGSTKHLTNIEQDLSDMKQRYEEANRRLMELTAPKPVQLTKSLDLHLITPSILADRFRHELYGNHWKQAFDKMTKKLKKDEKKVIHILGEICTEAYLFCKRAARNQMETMASSLLSPTANHYRSHQLSKRHAVTKLFQDQLPDELKKHLTHYRCRPSQEMLSSGVSDFLNQIDYDRTRFLRHVSERDFNEIMTYIRPCFELAWYMSVQEPPMYLLFKVKHGFDIDDEKFDKYKSRGKRVDFVIWPAVLAEEGGACLQKGVLHALPERV